MSVYVRRVQVLCHRLVVDMATSNVWPHKHHLQVNEIPGSLNLKPCALPCIARAVAFNVVLGH